MAARNFRLRLKVMVVFFCLVSVCLGIVLYGMGKARQKPVDNGSLKLLQQAYAAVMASYVEKPDSKVLVQKMVDGMLASLDPHSAYLPPEPYKEMTVQISGAFGGVGIELGTKDGKLTVIAPIDDTPAQRAGIQANDHIWKIDGTSTNGMNIGDAVKRMRGEKGTAVTLAVLRSDSGKPLIFHLIRDMIRVKSLKYKMLDNGYGFIRIAQFQERTGSDFKEALQKLHQEAGGELKGLVLDLRYNPGGLIHTCVEVANCFIGEDINNTVIVSTKGREQSANHVYNASLGTKEPRYPMVVLINGGSASASEILAGALQDHKRAVVLGTQSFGKGSVQSIMPLKGNAALKLTVARYYTPSGRSIQAKGIVPDIEVPNIPPPIKVAKGNELKEKDLEKSLPPDSKGEQKQEPALPEQGGAKTLEAPHGSVGNAGDLDKDFQLRRALELLQTLTLMKEKGLVGK